MATVKSCRICPKVYIEAIGKYVDSELFQELYRITGKDRKLTKRLYALSLNKEFRRNNGFDNSSMQNSIGEPSLLYFLEAIGMQEDKKGGKLVIIRPDGTKVNIDVIGFLNERIQNDRKSYPYKEAVEKVTKFNNDKSDVRRGFIATFKKVGESDGENMYSVSIVKDTYHNKQELISRVRDEELADKFSFLLKRLGITYTFENDKELSTQDVIDGFYNLIKISDSDEFHPIELASELAFKCGILAYKIMSDHPAMKSLRSALADSRILKEYKEKYGDENMSEEELVGHILADGLKQRLDENTYIKNKAERAWTNIKNFFSRLFRDKHYVPKNVLMREVEMSTKEIIKSFSSMDAISDEDLPTIIKLEEPSLIAFSDSENKAYLKIKEQLTLAAKKFEIINPKIASEFKSFLSKVYAHPENFKKDEYGNTIDDETRRFLLMDKIAEAIRKLSTDLSYTIDSNLDKCTTKLDIDNPQAWLSGFDFTRKSLGTAREYLTSSQYIIKALAQMIEELQEREAQLHPDRKVSVSDFEVIVGGEKVNLRSLQQKLEIAQASLTRKLMGMERDFFVQFLAFSDGSNAIMQNARIIYHGPLYKGNIKALEYTRGEKLTNPLYKKPRLYRVKDQLITIEDMLNSTEDISLFSRFIASMSNNEDILGAKIDKLAKRQQKESIDKTYQDVRTILALKDEGIKLGLSHDLHEIIETAPEFDKYGVPTSKELPTGNFIQELNYGMWEDDWQEFKENLIKSKEFQEEINRVRKESHIVRGLAYEKLIKEKRKEWHKLHSKLVKDLLGTRYVPNDSYKNEKWEALKESQKEYVEKWIEFKASKEEKIYGTVSYRLPQISGSAVATLSQHIDREGFFKGLASAVFPRLKASLAKRLDPQEFGTDATYNKPEEDTFSTELTFELEKIHRLPVYGVNKYTKEDRKKKLSTNIVNTMIAYCVMANTYNCFDAMVSVMEIGRTLLEERDSGINGIRKHNGMSGAYYRFDKFMDKQIYNINTTLVKNSNTVNALINGFNSLAAIMYLGGNIPGGLVNVGTGIRQLITEAAVGEFVSMKSMMEAFGIYMKSLVPMIVEDLGGKADIGLGLNKMSIFIDKMNALGNAKFELSSYEDNFAGWLERVLSPTEIAMLPYSAGEKLMQGVTYVAVAKDTSVYNLKYDDKGTPSFLKSNVWEMYSRVKEKSGKGVHKYALEQGDGHWIVPTDNYNTETIAKHYNGMLAAKEYLQKLQKLGKKDLSFLAGTSLTSGDSKIEGALELLGIQRDMDVTMRSINTALYRVNKFLEDVDWNTQKESDMMDVAREVNNRLHGIYNNQDKTAFSSNVFTNALLVMKNYVLGYIQNHFAPDHYSEVFKENIEGTFVTLAKVVALPLIGVPDLDARHTNYHFLQGVRMVMLPHSKNTQELMRQLGFSKNQAYNMKRNLFYVLSSLLLSLIKMLSANPEQKKKELEKLEKKDKGLFLEARKDWKEMQIELEKAVGNDPTQEGYNELLWGHIHYLSGRLLWELNSYLTPGQMWTELTNVTTMFPVALSAAADIIKITEYAISGDTYDKDDPNYMYEEDDKKWEVALIKKTPYLKSWYWLLYPYPAYNSHEYSNSLRKGR